MNQVLNHFRIMWLFCLFDLPTNTKKQRKDASDFRKNLMRLGFSMQQFSVYNNFCGSRERMEVMLNKIRKILPPEGYVMVLNMTDKQYGQIINFYCRYEEKLKSAPQQLELF